LELLRAVEHPERDGVVAHLTEAATQLEQLLAVQPASARDISRSATAVMSEAARESDPLAGAQVLHDAISRKDLSDVDRATLHGEYANALTAAGSFQAAETAYAEAARRYEAAGYPGMQWHARAMAAVALRESGDVAAAERRMEEILRDCPVPKVRANLLAGYARLIFEHRSDDPSRLLELQGRLQEALQDEGADAETLGRVALQLAQCEWLRMENAAARTALGRAQELLVRSNSPLLSAVRELATAYSSSD
jgi:hypothetical protein